MSVDDAYNRGDYATALRLARQLADRGDAAAQYNLGVMYAKGHGVSQNYGEALKWFHLAADQEYASAQYYLGIMYGNGQGVPQNDAEALKWLRLAADQGDPPRAVQSRQHLRQRPRRATGLR